MTNIVTYLTTVAALTLSASPAAATPSKETKTAIVRLHDLNLTDPDDRAVLDSRIRRAATTVCQDLHGAQAYGVSECIARTLAKARVQRDSHVAQQARRISDIAL